MPKEVKGSFVDSSVDQLDLAQMKEKWKGKYRDVSHEVALEHERQIKLTGQLNMFKKEYFKDLNLKTMGIKDTFGPGTAALPGEKVLWIRYIRGGDGERCTQGVVFSAFGNLHDSPNPEILMDLVDSYPQ